MKRLSVLRMVGVPRIVGLRGIVGLRILGLAALAVLAAGCFRLPEQPQVDPPAVSGRPGIGGTQSPRPSPQGSSLEGRFSYGTMKDYVDAVLPMITKWHEQTWGSGLPEPRQVNFVPRGASGPEGCFDGSGRRALYSSGSYEYCGADGEIYVGQDMLWDLYTEAGDAGPAVGLAHEWGHHIQQMVGVPAARTTEDAIAIEDQADCIAGAWTLFTDQQGWLEYPDDIEDIEALFPLIGSAEGPGRDHGTAAERVRSFTLGFEGGLDACEDFFPGIRLS